MEGPRRIRRLLRWLEDEPALDPGRGLAAYSLGWMIGAVVTGALIACVMALCPPLLF